MAAAERSLTVQARPEQVWALISDLSQWSALTTHRNFVSVYRTDFRLAPGAVMGAGAPFSISVNGREQQSWAVESWDPPKAFSAVLKGVRNGLFGARSSLRVAVAPVDSLTTRLELRFEFEFAHKYLGDFFNRLLSPDKAVERVLDAVCARFPALLERG